MRANLIKTLVWGLVFLALFGYRSLYSFDGLSNTRLVFTATDVLCLFLTSLVINRWMIPQLLYRKRTVLFVAALVVLFVAYGYSVQSVQWQWFRYTGSLPEEGKKVFHHFTYQIFNTWMIIFLGSMGIFLFRIVADQRIAQRRYEELKREKAETELNFLKAQINPHFLFNSINSIYGNIDKSNTVARDILLKFSEMLRYQLYECNSHRISIEKEGRYLQNYVELQRLRKEASLEVTLQIDDAVRAYEMAPLLLIPFVENAFKYVSNFEDKANRIDISLSVSGGQICFHVSNTRDLHIEPEVAGGKGIGIQNVKRRLELLYPGSYELNINERDDVFDVQLKLST